MLRNVIGLIALGLTLSSCSTFGPQGVIYYGRDVVLDTHNDVKPLKTGESCYNSFLSMVIEGDASIAKAKEDGDITRVASVSYHISNYFVYERYCTIITGE